MSEDPRRFVIVGNGVAGTTAAEHIRKTQPDSVVTLVAGEPYPLYNRVALPIFLKGRVQERNVMMRTREVEAQRGVDLLLDTWIDGLFPPRAADHLDHARRSLPATSARPGRRASRRPVSEGPRSERDL